MAAPTKTQGTVIQAIQNLANNTVLASAAIDVSTKFHAAIFVRVGRDIITALTNPVNIRIQASAKSSGNDTWETIAFLQTGIAAAITNTMTGSSNASGQNVLTATGNFTQTTGDMCFIKNGTIANSEFVRLQVVSAAVTVNVWDNLTNTQTSSVLYNKAEEFVTEVNCLPYGRLRVVIDTLATGQAVNVDAFAVTCDTIA